METQRSNPLAGYFRQPAIYIKLPSSGRWWADNALDLPVTEQIPVYPMTTKDEIILRTPDALLNGQGVVDVIMSCCPNIQNPWAMPSIDVDTVLIAIRIATYGNEMSFDSKCSHCGETNSHELDLTVPLSSITCPDYSKTVNYQDIKIKLKPQVYFNINQGNMINFEEQKIIELLNESTLDPQDKAHRLTESMKKLVDAGAESITASTEYIELPNGERVTAAEHLSEFYKNAESGAVRLVQDQMEHLAETAKIKPLHLKCNYCEKEYNVDMTFDYSSFFANGS